MSSSDDYQEENSLENEENWGNALPVEVSIETVGEDIKATTKVDNASDSESDFYGFEDGLIPVRVKKKGRKLEKVATKCPYCSYCTRRKDHLKRHVLRHPGQTLYQASSSVRQRLERTCSACGYKTKRLDHFKRHLMRHTGEKPHSCSCGYSTTHGIHLKRHIQRYSDPSKHFSILTTSNLLSRTSLPPNEIIVVKSPQNIPLKKTSCLNKMQKHKLKDLPQNNSTTKNVDEVLIDDSASKVLPTEVTRGKEVPELNGLPGDWEVGLWPVEVNVDGSSLDVSGDENDINRRRRVRGSPHICKDCGYSTMRGDHFKRHLMRHTGEKPFMCTLCEYRSTHAIHLKRHMSTHTNNRPFVCPHCPFRAIRPHHLRDHVRLHTGERPYVCHICGFSAAQSGNYRSHMRTHSDNRPFTCGLCGYATLKKYNLVTHMRIHNGKIGHSCAMCDYRSVKHIDLLRHVQRAHQVKPS